MRLHNRLVAIGAASITAVLALAGCAQPVNDAVEAVETVVDTETVVVDEATGDATQPASTVDQGAGADATTLELMTFVDLHARFYEEMAAQWNVEHPDNQIRIDARVLPFEAMHQRAQMSLHTGEEVPDIIDLELSMFPNFVRGEQVLMDLSDVAAPYENDLVQARMQLYARDGQQLGLPTHVGATLAYYNTDLLDAAGINWQDIHTWEDFKNAGIAYHEATGKTFGAFEAGDVFQLNLMVGQLGGEYLDENSNPQLTSPEVVKALQTIQDMFEAGAIDRVPGANLHAEEAYQALNNGDFAAVIMPAWYLSRFTNYMPEMSGHWVVAPAPTFGAEGVVETIGGGGTGTAVPVGAAHPELAKEFLAFAKLSEFANVQVWEQLGFDPVNMSVWTDEAVTHNPDNEFVQYFSNNPFDALNQVKDGIGLLESQKRDGFPVIHSLINTEIMADLFDGGNAQDILERAQSDAVNQIRSAN